MTPIIKASPAGVCDIELDRFDAVSCSTGAGLDEIAASPFSQRSNNHA